MSRWRIGFLAVGVALGLAAASGSGARAQGAAAVAAAPVVAPVTIAPGPTPQQAQQALSVLRDDAKRAEMIGVLETIARATPTPVGAAAASGLPTAAIRAAVPAAVATGDAAKLAIPLAPDSLGAQVLVGISERLESLSGDVSDTFRTLTNFTLLERWAVALAEDPDSRAELFDAGWKLLVVALLALGAEQLARRLVARPVRALMRIAPPSEASPAEDATNDQPPADQRKQRRSRAMRNLRRLPLTLGRLGLDMLPVLAVAAVGNGLLGSRLGEPTTTKLVILALLNSYVLCRAVIVTSRVILSPDAPGLRLVRLDDGISASMARWVVRLAAVALFGYALTEVALLFGLYRVAHDALLKLVALAVHLMLVVIVLQNRAPVAALIRPAPDKHGVLALLRSWLAPVWHVVVIFYIVALWGVWALDVPGGFSKLLLVFVSTTVVANLARMLSLFLVAGVEHAMTLDPKDASRRPGIDASMRRYMPLVRAMVEIGVGVAAALLLFQIWGIDTFSWFAAEALGGRLVSALATSAVTVVVALAIWEASNAAVQTHLLRLTRDGFPGRSARLRTLLPMLRTALLVAISLFAGLTILSQIGINIAPLLAGAGVIGIAIGFGSQKLVQDIITGLFLLLENTMQVGDVVTLGGLTGTVENLSIRTIRLRAIDGAVHIVPFSAVTTVTNMTRDFAYAMLDVSVGLNEEPDHISEVIQDVADKMRAEPRWGPAITDRMEIMGVEKFVDTAWVLRCRLKTVPSQRWSVARELNRRLKYRFDAEAIESPFTSYRALAAAVPPPPNAKEEAA